MFKHYLLLLLNIFNSAKAIDEINGYIGRTFDSWSVYYATGIIYHQDTDIKEPFQAWYDESQKASRIDYYDGKLHLK